MLRINGLHHKIVEGRDGSNTTAHSTRMTWHCSSMRIITMEVDPSSSLLLLLVPLSPS